MSWTWWRKAVPGAAGLGLFLCACHSDEPSGPAQQAEEPSPEVTAPVQASQFTQAGPDPRILQREQLSAAEALLGRDGSSLGMAEYRALESRLRGMVESSDSKDTVHLSLALLYEFHAPDEAYPAGQAEPGSGLLDDGRSRARVLVAVGSLQHAVESNPGNLAALWQLALLQENVDDSQAVHRWRQLVEQAPEHLQALTRLGEGLVLLEEHESAREIGERALQLAEARGNEEEEGRARNILGRVFLHQGKYQQAEEMFKNAAVRGDGSHWGCAYQSLGQLYATLGETDLPGMGAPADRAAVNQALNAYQRGDYVQALERIDQALARNPRDEFRVLRGFMLFFQAQDAAAARVFRGAQETSPAGPGPATGLAHLAIIRGDYELASQLLQPALHSWHQTRLSSKQLPRYYAFLHHLACLANSRIQLQGKSAPDGGAASTSDAELASVVCAMDLGFGAGPDAAPPAWTKARAPGRPIR